MIWLAKAVIWEPKVRPLKVTEYRPGAADCEALTERKMEPLDTGPAGTNKNNCLGFDWITVKVTPATKRLEGKPIVTCWLAVRTV